MRSVVATFAHGVPAGLRACTMPLLLLTNFLTLAAGRCFAHTSLIFRAENLLSQPESLPFAGHLDHASLQLLATPQLSYLTVVLYGVHMPLTVPTRPRNVLVVAACDTVTAALTLQQWGAAASPVAVLNFADPVKPGGGYMNGRTAQGTALMHAALSDDAAAARRLLKLGADG